MQLRVNGARFELDPPVGRSLADTLRDELGLTGTKIACGEGHCGACTVLVDGVPHLSCITLVHTVDERDVTTIEGLREHPLVDAFVRCDALQCGFCTPGRSSARRRSSRRTPSRRATRFATRWRETSAAAAPTRGSRRRSRPGAADPTEEVEGRYTETWIVVEEDALDQWPAGARSVVGRPARRSTGSSGRAARRATPPTSVPGMLHTALLGSPRQGAGAVCERRAGEGGARRSRRPDAR